MNRDQCLAAMFDNPVNRTILQRLPAIGVWPMRGLPGRSVSDRLERARTGRAAQYGIKDYDIFYFDPDTSYEAEDAVIRKARALFADVKADIEVRNQARVASLVSGKVRHALPAAHAFHRRDRPLSDACSADRRSPQRHRLLNLRTARPRRHRTDDRPSEPHGKFQRGALLEESRAMPKDAVAGNDDTPCVICCTFCTHCPLR